VRLVFNKVRYKLKKTINQWKRASQRRVFVLLGCFVHNIGAFWGVLCTFRSRIKAVEVHLYTIFCPISCALRCYLCLLVSLGVYQKNFAVWHEKSAPLLARFIGFNQKKRFKGVLFLRLLVYCAYLLIRYRHFQ
jgi:hypothetical protein